MNRSYSTTSSSALCVLAGVLPVGFLLRERLAMYSIRRRWGFRHGNMSVYEEEIGRWIKGRVRRETLRMWQESWTNDTVGRVTHTLIPDVQRRLKSTWISPGYHTSQMLTGHGDFASKLWGFSLGVGPTCSCGAPEETMMHVLAECPVFTAERGVLRAGLGEEIRWPSSAQKLVSREGYPYFEAFARGVIDAKETKWRRRLEGNTPLAP